MGLIRRLKKTQKVAHTDGHCDLETESAQWVDSVKSDKGGLITKRPFGNIEILIQWKSDVMVLA